MRVFCKRLLLVLIITTFGKSAFGQNPFIKKLTGFSSIIDIEICDNGDILVLGLTQLKTGVSRISHITFLPIWSYRFTVNNTVQFIPDQVGQKDSNTFYFTSHYSNNLFQTFQIVNFMGNGNVISNISFNDSSLVGSPYQRGSILQYDSTGAFVIATRGVYLTSLLKFDSNGNWLWNKKIESDSFPYKQGIRDSWRCHDNGTIFCGWHDPYSVLACKIKSNGNVEWYRRFSFGLNYGFGESVIQTSDNNFLIAGKIFLNSSTLLFPLILKIDSIGNIMWYKAYYNPLDTNLMFSFMSIYEKKNGNIIALGEPTNQPYNPVFVELDNNGNILNSKFLNLNNQLRINSAQIKSDILFFAGDQYLSGDPIIGSIDTNFSFACNEFNFPLDIYTIPSCSITDSLCVQFPYGSVDNFNWTSNSLSLTINPYCQPNYFNAVVQSTETVEFTPNPTFNYFTINFSQNIKKAIIEIYNMFGEKVKEETVFNTYTKEMQISRFPAGIYMVRIKADERSYCKKLIVEHD